jgi:hypothetical protein
MPARSPAGVTSDVCSVRDTVTVGVDPVAEAQQVLKTLRSTESG